MGVSGAQPLVSRLHEIDLVAAELARSGSGGVALRGPAGVGKSRLAQECADQARAEGCSLVSVRATESARNVPFGAMAALLPALGSEANPLAAASEPILAQRRPGSRLIVAVDDAHWLDDTSAALVHHLVARHDVFALLTLRSGLRTSDAVRALWRDPTIRQVHVGPMADDDIVRLAEGLIGGRLDANLAVEVAALAAGNPLAAVELIHGGREEELLAEHDGVWTAAGDLARSAAVTDLVARRLERLGDDDRGLLELIAFGEPLTLDAFGADDADRLAALEERALVSVRATAAHPEIWLAHPLYGEGIRGNVSELRRRAVLRELVDRLADLDHEVDRLRVALWSLESGRTLPADHLSAAAISAMRTHRFDLAAQLIGAVPPADRTAEQAYALLVATWWVGDGDANRAARAAAWEHVRRDGDDELAARVADFERIAWRVLGEASPEEPPASAEPMVSVAPAEIAESILAVHRRTPHAERRQHSALGLALGHAGRPLDALEHLDRALREQIAAWDTDPMLVAPSHPIATVVAAVSAHLIAGDIEGARRCSQLTTEFDLGADIVVLDAYTAYARGLVARRAGELRRAHQQLAHAALRFDRSLHRHGPFAVIAHSFAALTAAQRRDVVAARRHLRAPERAAGSSLGGMAGVAAGWLAAAERDIGAAAEHFRAALERNVEQGHVYFAIEATTGLARIGRAELAADHLGAFDDVQGRLLTGLRDAVAATLDGDPERLGALSTDFERMGALVDAAELATEQVRCLVRLRRRREATAAAVRLRELLAHCEGLSTPGVVVPIEPVALTDREREVALLAADRVPAKEIAERLFISRRTVTNHLQRAYEKLGVSSRAELREALGLASPV